LLVEVVAERRRWPLVQQDSWGVVATLQTVLALVQFIFPALRECLTLAVAVAE
jgi:hypothetical protein